MDPSIIKFLEDDEDESMHSGADVDALTAALNRDIEGDFETGVLTKGTNSTSQHLLGHWQASGQENNHASQSQHQGENPQLSQVESMRHGSDAEDKQCHNERQQGCDQIPSQPEMRPVDRLQLSATDPLHCVDNNQIKLSEQNSAHCPTVGNAQQPGNQKHNEQRLNSQQLPTASQANDPMQRIISVSIPFQSILQILQPHLDKDRDMQLQALFAKLRSQEMSKENFLRVCKSIVGDQMIKQAVQQLQMQHVQAARQTNQNQLSSQIQVTSVQSDTQSSTDQRQVDASFSTIDNNSQNPQKPENMTELKGMDATPPSSNLVNTNDSEGEIPKVPLQTAKKPLQQMQLPKSSFSMYGNTSNFHAHAYPSPSVGASVTSLKPQTQNSQMRQAAYNQSMSSTKLGATQPMNIVNVPRRELQNAANEAKRLQGGPFSHLTSQQQKPVAWQSANIPNKEHRTSVFPSISCVKQEVFDQDTQPHSKRSFTVPQSSSFGSVHTDQGNPMLGSVKCERQEVKTTKIGFSTSIPAPTQVSGPGVIQTVPSAQMQPRSLSAIAGSTMPPQKPFIGQKKPLEVQGSSPPHTSKKQKTSGSGTILDQSIEHLNDVTAVSGVNLREEEEQLLSAPKEDSQPSEATRRFVQEEEDRLILQKELLQKKLVGITSKFGVDRIGSDVERCLSMCVEERLRGLISNMIRLSKQRTDIEKSRHRLVVTSDVKRQILVMNQKAREEWEKKQAEEAEKLRNETEGNTGANADKDKDEGQSKTQKINKEEDDKMRATAANVAARAAVGGDDLLSKWQLMAEQARQKREGIVDATLSYQESRTSSGMPSTNFERNLREHREASGKRGLATSISGGMRVLGKRPGVMPCTEVERVISTKDLIAILEREPQMSRSTLIYRLYEKMGSDLQQNITS